MVHLVLVKVPEHPPLCKPCLDLACECATAAVHGSTSGCLTCNAPDHAQAGNGIAWSSAAYVIIFESQSLAVRPAAVAICIAAANLSASVLESRLLCLLRTMYYLLVLAVSALALVSGEAVGVRRCDVEWCGVVCATMP
jgi:hypothetical protein